ncbi:hypothetical protein V6N13_107459 [Hibiscus sabdariffa]
MHHVVLCIHRQPPCSSNSQKSNCQTQYLSVPPTRQVPFGDRQSGIRLNQFQKIKVALDIAYWTQNNARELGVHSNLRAKENKNRIEICKGFIRGRKLSLAIYFSLASSVAFPVSPFAIGSVPCLDRMTRKTSETYDEMM